MELRQLSYASLCPCHATSIPVGNGICRPAARRRLTSGPFASGSSPKLYPLSAELKALDKRGRIWPSKPSPSSSTQSGLAARPTALPLPLQGERLFRWHHGLPGLQSARHSAGVAAGYHLFCVPRARSRVRDPRSRPLGSGSRRTNAARLVACASNPAHPQCAGHCSTHGVCMGPNPEGNAPNEQSVRLPSSPPVEGPADWRGRQDRRQDRGIPAAAAISRTAPA